tara:strand:+ start:402 stop:791 length:390 start_codon:yes stop_codon:yes gene_type:complete
MTEAIIAGVIGLVIGIGGTIGVSQLAKPAAIPPKDETAETQQEVIKQLTSLDLVEPLCKPENIKEAKELLLCRELTCLQFTRGIDAQTAGSQCEEISNISNKIIQMEFCAKKTTDEEKKNCMDLFWRRQ